MFYGANALGGTRTDLRFEIDATAVSGPPWNTVALVEWRDHFMLPDGTRAGNQGVHVLRMAWGKVTSLHVHCDTQLLAGILNEMQRQGRAEAGLAPIGNARAGAQSPIAPAVQPAFAAAARS